MRFEHRDGEKARSAVSLGPVRDTVPVVGGVFEVDDDREDFDDVRDRLEAAGHTPIDAPRDEAIKDADAGDETADEDEIPKAGDFDEEQLVDQLDYREKQAIAKQYDDIDGSASEPQITEELIKQRREEVAE